MLVYSFAILEILMGHRSVYCLVICMDKWDLFLTVVLNIVQ